MLNILKIDIDPREEELKVIFKLEAIGAGFELLEEVADSIIVNNFCKESYVHIDWFVDVYNQIKKVKQDEIDHFIFNYTKTGMKLIASYHPYLGETKPPRKRKVA